MECALVHSIFGRREERMSEKMKIFQKIQHVTVGIAFTSVLLPLIFWKKIPKKIPQHYNGAGEVDIWSDKTSLILLFFVILFLLGMMSVVTYFIRTSGSSANASESEKKTYGRLYPVIVLMNLCLMLMFAYMVFCSVTCRALGKWFLPVSLLLTFAPLVWYIYRNTKETTTKKEMKRAYVKQEKEEAKEAISYRTKIDLWMALLILIPLVMEVKIGIDSVRAGKPNWLVIGTSFLILFIMIPLVFIRYTLYNDYILVRCYLFGTERIPYDSITNIKKTWNPLSSAAMSLRRIQIDYTVNGKDEMTLISPVKRDEFLKEVEKRRAVQNIKKETL